MDYLVTGATGFVGNNMVRCLLNNGHSVRVLIRPGSDPRPLEGLDVDCVVGDVCSKEDANRAITGCSNVIHAAASVKIGWQGFDAARKINVAATEHMARGAAESGAKFLFVSSVDALAPSRKKQPVTEDTPDQCKVDCTYCVTKREAELKVLQFAEEGLHAVIANPGFMLGPNDWKPSSGRMLIDVAKKFSPFAPPGGMSICDVRDVVDAIYVASEFAPSGRRFILAGHNVKFWRAWRAFAKAAGTSGPISPFGPLVARIVGMVGDIRTSITGNESEINSAMLRMACMHHYYSSDRAIAELNYRIRPLEETVRDAWQWFATNGYV
ncbi:MAG: NAD-dependent epimerase/dehydratase family protein [Planctomycetales bacterium]|nr:NAD-dependent epimerase/dehydratase family protein [Planctomycetales bacterium]